jgi:hypothetical protein
MSWAANFFPRDRPLEEDPIVLWYALKRVLLLHPDIHAFQASVWNVAD